MKIMDTNTRGEKCIPEIMDELWRKWISSQKYNMIDCK